MNRRDFMKTIAAATGVTLIQGFSSANEGAKKYNVLFIAVDDLRPNLGCYGDEEVISPNIDALAKRGCMFSNHYVQVATCGASRASLLIGQVPRDQVGFSNGAFGPFIKLRRSGVKPDLNDPHGIVALPELFKLNGYTTVATGKVSHTPTAIPGVWDRDRQFTFRSISKYPIPKIANGRYKERLTAKMIDAPDADFIDGLIAESAIKELQILKADGQPFFLGVGFHKPHLPFYAPKKYWDLYERDKLKLAKYTETPRGCNREISLHESFEMRGQYTQLDVPDAETEARILQHGYNACVSFIDAQVGKVLAELDRLGLRKNTIIILWGDHGWHLGDYGTWGKHTCFEWALRSPLIVCMPGMQSTGAVCNGLVETVDIYPTLADICGFKTPGNLDGQSLLPLLNNPRLPGKKFTRGYMAEGGWRSKKPLGYTIRTEQYRLVQWRDKKTKEPTGYVELYDHINDPGETVNVADNNPEVLRELIKLLEKNNSFNKN